MYPGPAQPIHEGLQVSAEFKGSKNCFSENCPMKINHNETCEKAKVIIIIKDYFALKRKNKKESLSFTLRMGKSSYEQHA